MELHHIERYGHKIFILSNNRTHNPFIDCDRSLFTFGCFGFKKNTKYIYDDDDELVHIIHKKLLHMNDIYNDIVDNIDKLFIKSDMEYPSSAKKVKYYVDLETESISVIKEYRRENKIIYVDKNNNQFVISDDHHYKITLYVSSIKNKIFFYRSGILNINEDSIIKIFMSLNEIANINANGFSNLPTKSANH